MRPLGALLLLGCGLALTAGCQKAIKTPDAGPPLLRVVIEGEPARGFTGDDLARVPTIAVAPGDEADAQPAEPKKDAPKPAGPRAQRPQTGWSLRTVVQTLIGPDARVTAVIGETTARITTAEWADPARTPLLRFNRRSLLKFEWVAAGRKAPGDVRNVTELHVRR